MVGGARHHSVGEAVEQEAAESSVGGMEVY
jgi:hypothetical protein